MCPFVAYLPGGWINKNLLDLIIISVLAIADFVSKEQENEL